MKEIIYKTKLFSNRLTNYIRALPNFLIIGVPRGGTTSLFNYLIQHPLINPPLWKEIDFFGTNFNKGIQWYKSFFPLRKKGYLTGEASPIYLYHPLAPKRIFEIIPEVKIIVLLRNPVDRTFSHYWQSVRKKRESLTFEEAIQKQMTEKLLSDHESLCTEIFHRDNDRVLNQYISGSIYLERIKRFFKIFPKENILILASEELYNKPQTVCDNLAEFLNIPKWNLRKFKKYNFHSEQPQMDNHIRKQLADYFKPHNKKLYNYLNRDFGWEE